MGAELQRRVRNEAGCANLRSAGGAFANIRRSCGADLAHGRARARGRRGFPFCHTALLSDARLRRRSQSGRDLRIGVEEQLPELSRALVGDKPDVIIVISDWALHATRAATSTIPIVAAPMGADPVRADVAESWAHPGGNVTGVSLIAPELEVKRPSLLHEALPSVHRIAVLANHRKIVEAGLSPLRKAAAEAGLEVLPRRLFCQRYPRA